MNVTGRSSSHANNSRAPASRHSQMRSQQSNRSGVTDLYKYEIPEKCHISMLKKVKIEQLEEKFKLISHPFPQISGEMLVFRPKEDQTEKDSIIYRDYSLRKRLPTSEKTTQSLVEQLNKKKKKSENDLQKL